MYPKKKQQAARKFNIRNVLLIQKVLRGFQARKLFHLIVKKARENPTSKLMKKYVTSVNHNLFVVRIHYNNEQNHFTVTAKSADYHADIPQLVVPVEEVDKNEFSDKLTNLKRLVDILVPYVNILFYYLFTDTFIRSRLSSPRLRPSCWSLTSENMTEVQEDSNLS